MVRVEQWAEIRRLHLVEGVSIREIARRLGLYRQTIRRVLERELPPLYARRAAGSKLDPLKEEIQRLLRDQPRLSGVRVRELLAPLGCEAGRTTVDAYLREVRPLFAPKRAFRRVSYRPGGICQFDVWEPRGEVPVGHGQTRRGYVVVACLGYSRASAGVLVFRKETPDLLAGVAGCLARFGGVPRLLCWDRQAGIHGHAGRPSEAFAGFCGALPAGWHFYAPADPQAKGAVERFQGYLESSFEPARRFANALDFQHQLDAWCARANRRQHATLRERPIDRLADELGVMRSLPGVMPETDRRLVVRVSAEPYLRVDTNDYSLDPRLVGRRVEVRISQAEIRAVALDTGEQACAHARSFAKHRTITASEHAAFFTHPNEREERVIVEQRPLSRYDELIPL